MSERVSRSVAASVVGIFALALGMASMFLSIRADQRFVIRTKPVEVRMHKHSPEDTHYDHMKWAYGSILVPEDMWLTEIVARVSGAPHGILHTAYLSSEVERDLWCPNNPRFLWSGSTVTAKNAKTFEPPYGIFLKKDQVLTLEVAFHNGNLEGAGEDYTDVAMTVEAAYEPADATSRTTPLSLVMLDAAGCDYHRPVFTVPAHAKAASFDSKDNPFVFKSDAVIVRSGAHFHASYDENVRNTLQFFLNDEMVEEFTTTNISDEEERNPRLLVGKTPLHLKVGDSLWIRALFDNSSDVPVYEGMAAVGFYYYLQ